MPRTSSRTPTYRKRKGYTQALVTLKDAQTGQRKDFWLGEYNTPQSRERYHRIIAEWEANQRCWPTPDWAEQHDPYLQSNAPSITILIRDYWRWAERYYQPNESGTLRVVLRLIREHYGSLPADQFGPKKLRHLREAMIVGDSTATPPRPEWSRKYINQQMQRIRRMFRWAASYEMVPSSVYQALDTVESLKRGRTEAKEGKRVEPVPMELINKTLPLMNRQVRAVVQLQLLTGARPGELLGMRKADLRMDDESGVWTHRPQEHKNQYRGQDRIIFVGPRAQEIINPFLDGRPDDSYLFSPSEAEAERRAALTANRKTPLSCGNRTGTNRIVTPRKKAGDRYTTPSYYSAIQRACDRAAPPPPSPLRKRDDETLAQWKARLTKKQKQELKAWLAPHRWHPHQLRHNAATDIRKAFGLEAAQLALGHASAQITDAIYAERDHAKVIEVMQRVG